MASTEAYARFPPGRRPSEGSTSSARSATTQPNNIDPNPQNDSQSYNAAAWLVQQQQQQPGQLRQIAPAPRQTSPEYPLHGLPMPEHREYSAEPSVHNGVGAQYRFQTQHQQQQQQQQQQHQQASQHMSHRQSLPGDYMPVNGHPGLGAQLMDRNDSPAPDSGLDIGATAPSKSRSNTNNDQEMRELFTRNSHRSLQDVATELHGNERGPSSERSRQLFAMLWIKSSCRKGSTSVPRSRVYTSYVRRCAREKIAVLNPASFGKLVRVLYPGLRTRRLGVRGESKYHYVDFELEVVDDDVEEDIERLSVVARSIPSFAESLNFSNATRPSTAAGTEKNIPSPVEDAIVPRPEDNMPKETSSREVQHAIYNHPQVSSVAELDTTGSKTAKKISLQIDDSSTSMRLVLPPIEPYLPQGTDMDAAKSLEALYLSHCTSLIECIRFCKEKNFFHLFAAFHGTLTVPVQKLLVNPALEPWVELSDLRMYQNMMQIVSVVALQVIPPYGLQSLRNISERLVSHIRTSFEGQREHLFRAKEAPAALFADLLDRALRVNTTAHATANFLHNHANRTQMYIDFIAFVRPRKIAQSVPLEGMEDVVNLLVYEIRQLLDPRDVPWDVESVTVQGDVYLQNPNLAHPENEGPRETANILDRWVGFLKSLPSRFPYASHADIVQYVQIVGTTMMRDLTISRAESFGAWWCLKCWIDEMIWFLAEKGGFMKQSTTHAISGTKRKSQHGTEEIDHRSHKRLSTGSVPEDSGFHEDAQFVMNMTGNSTQVLAPLTPSLENQNQHVVNTDSHPNFADDSGISLRMSGEDSPMTKFTNHLESQRMEDGNHNATGGLR